MSGFKASSKTMWIALTVAVCLVTLFVRIPLPSRGYFNVGDVAVVFAGLVFGRMAGNRSLLAGMSAGGIGSALADILGGFGLFAPITLVAKGLEGLLAGLAARATGVKVWFLLAAGGGLLVAVYFVAELLMPSIGLQGAVAELLPNIVQGIGGAVGGRITFAAYCKMTGSEQK